MMTLKPARGAHYTGRMSRLRNTLMAGMLAGLSLGSCRCNEEDLNDLLPEIVAAPNPVTFAYRQVDADTDLPLVITNGLPKPSSSK